MTKNKHQLKQNINLNLCRRIRAIEIVLDVRPDLKENLFLTSDLKKKKQIFFQQSQLGF